MPVDLNQRIKQYVSARFCLLRFTSVVTWIFLLSKTGLVLANPSPIRITDYRQDYPIITQAEVLQSSVTHTEIGRYWGAFKPLKLQELNIRNASDYGYWFRFTVYNQTDQHLYARLTHGGYSRAELYEWDGRRSYLLGIGGMDASANELYMHRTTAIIPLNLPPGGQKTYLLRTQRLWVRQSPIILYPEYALLVSAQLLDLEHGLLLGCLLMAFLYVLVSYWLSREISYGWLAIQILFQLLQSLFGEGLIPGYFVLPDGVSVSQLFYVSIALGGIASRQFQCHFLPLETHGNRFIRVGYWVHLATFVFYLGVALFQQSTVIDYLVPVIGVLYFFVLYSDWVVYRNGYKPALYLLITQLFPLLLGPLVLLQQTGVIAGGLDYSLIPFSVITYTGFALTVGYKVRLYKDEAEALILEQNQSLEHLVTERTQALQTEKHRADQQSERLKLALRELNHRVRNNLAVVSSLLKLQSNSNTIDPQKTRDAFRESRQRVDAMALIHQQLYQSDEVTTIDMPVFMTRLTNVLSEAYGYTNQSLKLDMELEPVVVPVEKAVPLGLLLNEVLTNAFKYGLPNAENPCLTLSLRMEDELYLDIHDNGPGIDPAVWQSKAASFGRRLIEALTQQLNGTYQLTHDEGTQFHFCLPITQELPQLA